MYFILLLTIARSALELILAAVILHQDFGRFESTALALLVLLYTQIQQTRIGVGESLLHFSKMVAREFEIVRSENSNSGATRANEYALQIDERSEGTHAVGMLIRGISLSLMTLGCIVKLAMIYLL